MSRVGNRDQIVGNFLIPTVIRYSVSQVQSIEIDMLAGNDKFKGDDGNDTIYGGDDGLEGDTGNDLLCGEAGQDRLEGDAGFDFLIGGFGADLLTGDSDGDLLIGHRVTFENDAVAL
jgi:Ca2+-binding RTX toxin-like protein